MRELSIQIFQIAAHSFRIGKYTSRTRISNIYFLYLERGFYRYPGNLPIGYTYSAFYKAPQPLYQTTSLASCFSSDSITEFFFLLLFFLIFIHIPTFFKNKETEWREEKLTLIETLMIKILFSNIYYWISWIERWREFEVENFDTRKGN